MDTRRREGKAKLDRLESEIASLEADLESFSEVNRSFKSSREMMDANLTEDGVVALMANFDNIVKQCKSEQEVLKKFLDSVNAHIKDTTSEATKLNETYKNWKDNLKSSYNFHLSQSLPGYEILQVEYEELPSHPDSCFASKYLLGGVSVGLGLGAAAVVNATGLPAGR